MKGRKPLPTGVKALRPNSHYANTGRREPELPVGVPYRPAHLTGEALAEWNRIVPQLQACGILTTIDGSALAAYCQVYGRWVEAEEAAKARTNKDGKITGGLVVQTTKGTPMQNPYVLIARQCIDQMRQYLIEFGMTPSSRMRVSARGEGKAQDPLEAFIADGKATRKGAG